MMTEAEETPTPADVTHKPTQSNLESSLNHQVHVEHIVGSLPHKNILHEIRTDTSRIKSTLMRPVSLHLR